MDTQTETLGQLIEALKNLIDSGKASEDTPVFLEGGVWDIKKPTFRLLELGVELGRGSKTNPRTTVSRGGNPCVVISRK